MKPASRFVLTLRYGAALALFLVTAAGGATSGARAQGQVKGINEIIRSLAPIKGPLRTSNTQARQSIDLDIRFAVNKARPLPSARPQLRALGLALSAPELQHIAVEIAGHTDATGRAVYNKALSLRRARAVSAYLQQKFRIDPSRLAVAGYGEEQLKDPANSAGAVNRRVEIAVISPAASTTSTAPDASTATLKTSRAGNDDTESGTWGDLLRNRDGAQTFMAQAEANGQVRVIVALSAPKTNAAQAQGWRNLNDYIRDIQNQALTTLGWTNINDLVRYDYTPAMAMSVTPARLRQLLQGEAVAQVFVDQMLSPSLLQSVPHIGLPMPRATSRSGAGQAVGCTGYRR